MNRSSKNQNYRALKDSFGDAPQEIQEQFLQRVDQGEQISPQQKQEIIQPIYRMQKQFSETDIDLDRNNYPQGARLSLPMFESSRKMITKYVLMKIMELRMDYNIAQEILDSLDDNQFNDEQLNNLLGQVINVMLEFQIINNNGDSNASQGFQGFYSILGQNQRAKVFNEEEKSNSQILLEIDRVECQICMQKLPQDQIFTLEQCQHIFCRQCMDSYLSNSIMISNVIKIKCPQDGCLTVMDDGMIHNLIGEELYAKMLQFRRFKILGSDKNIRFCPRPGCEFYAKRQNNEEILQCECGQLICFKCSNSVHPKISCEDAMDKQFKQAIIQFKIQKCPQCVSPIQKNYGCNHMTCHNCKYQFCWLCLQKYSSRHYSEMNIIGCPGLQNSEMDPFRFPNLYRALWTIALILIAPLLLVLSIVGFVLYLPLLIISQCPCDDETRHCRCIQYMGIWGKMFSIFFLGLFCILLSPISVAIIVIAAVVILIGVSIGLLPYLIYCLVVCYRDR